MITYNCPKCNSPFAIGTKFCQSCGFNLENIPLENMASSHYSHQNEQQQNTGWQAQQQTYYANGIYVYPKASIGDRFLALLVDALVALGLSIPAIIFFIIGIGAIGAKNPALGIVLLITGSILFAVPLGYAFIKDGLGEKGQGYGKRATGLMVVDITTNEPCTKGKSALRYLIGTLLGIIPLGGLIEPILVLTDKDGRRLADKAANTQVIEVRHYKQ